MKNTITKTIIFHFSNKFTKTPIVSVSVPYLPFLCVDGYYSKLYKRMKDGAAVGCQKSLVVGKHQFQKAKTTRMVISLPNGAGIDMPWDVNEKDIQIINLHLEALRIAIS